MSLDAARNRLNALARPGDLWILTGSLAPGLPVDFYAKAAATLQTHGAGFVLEHRFATWDLRPWRDDADFAVSILRVPPDA